MNGLRIAITILALVLDGLVDRSWWRPLLLLASSTPSAMPGAIGIFAVVILGNHARR